MDEALRRAEAYHAAGADGILIHSRRSTADQVLEFAHQWAGRAPLVIVPTKYYATPTQRFRDAGISLVIWANHNLRAALQAMRETSRQIYREQSLADVEGRVADLGSVFTITGNRELAEAEERYLPSRPETNAIILAATRGSKLRELTENKPKCMLDVRGEPLLRRLTRSLNAAGISGITVVGGYKAGAITPHGLGLGSLDLLLNEDFATTGEVASLAKAVERHVGGLKIGLEFFCAQGPEGVRQIVALGKDVFLDLKLHDIPNTVAGAVRAVAQLGVRYVTIHSSGGPAMLEAAVEAAAGRVRLLGVSVLTSLDDEDLAAVGQMGPSGAQVERLAKLAVKSGLDGLIAAAPEIAPLRRIVGREMVLMIPGIRPQGSDKGDQKRVMTPEAAMAAGADFLVIGRPIIEAADPAAAAAAICAPLQGEAAS